MRSVQRRAAAICVAAVAVAAAFAAASASGSGGGCQLAVRMTLINGSRGAGNVSYKLTLTNRGRRSCPVTNQPDLRLLGANGQNLPTKVIASGRAGSVLLKPGKSASGKLRFSPDIPGPGEPKRGPCEPKAHSIKALGGSAGVVGPISPPTSVCEHGTMRMTSLR